MAHMSMYRYRLVAAQWESLTRDEAQSIADAANNATWYGHEPHRFGLKECVAIETPEVALFGYYTQESEREQRTLTESKGEEIHNEPHAEKYLFVVLPNLMLMGLQAKRVADMPSRSEIVERVQDLLRLAFNRTFRNFGSLERIQEGASAGEYREVFFATDTERVMFLKLRDLSGDVPGDFHYFNPNYDLNAAFREASLRDRAQLLEVALTAPPEGNLKRSPSARGFIEASRDPREMRYIRQDQTEHTIRTRDEGAIRIQADDSEIKELTRQLALLIARAISNPRGASPIRKQENPRSMNPISQPTLFE